MRWLAVVVVDVLAQDALELAAADDEQLIEALLAQGAHEALGVGVGVRRPDPVDTPAPVLEPFQAPQITLYRSILRPQGALYEPQERLLLKNVLSLHDVRVVDVMVPRADIIAVNMELSLGEILSVFRTAGHSRLPVYAARRASQSCSGSAGGVRYATAA